MRYSRPEVANDVISGQDVEAFQDYISVNLWLITSVSFEKIGTKGL